MRRQIRVLVTGISGSGKSTVAQAVAERLSTECHEFGILMTQTAMSSGLLQPHEVLKSVKLARRSQLQGEVATQVAACSAEVCLIVAHLIVEGPEGYVPGFQPTVLDRLDISAIALMTAPIIDLTARKDRIVEDGPVQLIESLRRLRWMVEVAAIHQSLRLGVPLRIIANPNGQLPGSVDELLDFLDSLSP